MNMTKLDDLGFKYSINGGSWQYEGVTATNVVGTSADMIPCQLHPALQ